MLYQNGLAAFTAGDYAKAVSLFQRLVDLFGNESGMQTEMEAVFYALGCSLYNQGEFTRCIETFEEYLKRFAAAKLRDEAAFRIGSAHQFEEAYESAVTAYRGLMAEHPASPFAEDAGYQIAICRLLEEKNEEAIAALEAFVASYPSSELAAQARVLLARAYFQAARLQDAVATLDALAQSTKSMSHVVYANFLAIEVGDAAFDETDYELALRAYRRVRTRQSLIRLQRQWVSRIEADLAAVRGQAVDPARLAMRFRQERRLQEAVAGARDALSKLESMADYDAGLFHRIGRCFYAVDRFWESRVAFARVVTEASDPKVREAGHFDLILSLHRLRRFEDLIGEADRYLAAWSDDAALVTSGRVPSVAFLRAEAYVNQERFEEAEGEMRSLLEAYPEHAMRTRIEFYLALSVAMLERFPEAIQQFEAWRAAHPDDPLRSEVDYWLPVAMYYNGQHAEALPMFQAYAQANSMTVYAPEAEYRAALCRYSLEQFRECALDLDAWLQRYPEHVFRWEALVTLGDARAAAGLLEPARDAYRQVGPEAGAFHFLSLQQLAKVYQALDTEVAYAEMAEVFSDYVRATPDSPNSIEAAHHAGTALRKIGRTDDARRFYWSILERYGNRRDWEGFGPLLDDLRGLYRDAEPGRLVEDLTKAVEKARAAKETTLLARLVLAKHRWDKTDPAVASLDLLRRFGADPLDSEALAFAGESLVQTGDTAQGLPLLERLLAEFPASQFADVAHARRAEVFLAAGDATNALASAVRALEMARQPAVYVDALFTEAQALQALGLHADAIESYNEVVANRVAPRPMKPQSLLGMAACYEALGEVAKAIPYYQRIYVMYQAYADAVARAYLGSGRAFEQLKDWAAAARTYEEMLALESMKGRPETEEARARLAKLKS